MMPIVESVNTTIDLNSEMPFIRHNVTRVISTKPIVRFTCAHCKSVFETTNWTKTKGNNYSASCPCCPYRAWARR